MARVEIRGNKKESAAEKRAREAREAAAAAAQDASPARRGEDDHDLDEPQDLGAASAEDPGGDTAEASGNGAAVGSVSPAEVPHQADAVETHRVIAVSPEAVVLTRDTGFEYTELPEDADPLEHVAHARRGIANANRALTKGMGKLGRDYVLSAGRYLWYATQKGRLKAAGFKSVESFAKPLGLERHDVYRLRKAVPVYEIVGDLVEEPLNERTIRELYKTLTNDKDELELTDARKANLRAQFEEMKKSGRVSSAGAVAARKLLALGDPSEIIESEPGSIQKPPAVEQLNKARKTKRLVDLELLKEVQEEDPDAVKQYVSELKAQYEAAEKLLQGA
ncbi:hypothetical protein ABZ502_17840 [Streptomyces abikoensis]|uniref:hypothetical protein n=1 Tax=Streptomyces abikoensis TaxID=97398 RepID=UPI0033E89B8C